MVFCALFSITLETAEDSTAFINAFKKLQDHVIKNEPGTLTYEVHQVFADGKVVENQYVVVERYVSRYHLEEIHLKSAPFAEFFAVLGGLKVKAQNLQTYENDAVQAALDGMPASQDVGRTDPLLQRGVLIFGGARIGASPLYKEEAISLGKYIATKTQRPLVYGGGTVGVMGAVAETVKKSGGKVVAIIPKPLCPREASGEMIGDLIYYAETLSVRKSIMFAHADTVVALPGGVGTFDELLEVITLFQLNAYRPKIALVNVNGFFEPFLALLRHLVREGFLEDRVLQTVLVKETAEEAMQALENFTPPSSPSVGSHPPLTWHTRP